MTPAERDAAIAGEIQKLIDLNKTISIFARDGTLKRQHMRGLSDLLIVNYQVLEKILPLFQGEG